MIQEHQLVVLLESLPETPFREGDIGTVVHIHGEHEGYALEFADGSGVTLGIVDVYPSQIRGLGSGDLLHARLLAG